MRQHIRLTLALAALSSFGAALLLGALLAAPCGERDALAARYNLRSRTDRFFDRANPPRAASTRQTADEETAVAGQDAAKPQADKRRVTASKPAGQAKTAAH